MGLCKLKEKSFHDAIQHFQTAQDKETMQQSNEKNPGIHDGLGTAHENLGEFDEALVQYEEAILAQPENIEFL